MGTVLLLRRHTSGDRQGIARESQGMLALYLLLNEWKMKRSKLQSKEAKICSMKQNRDSKSGQRNERRKEEKESGHICESCLPCTKPDAEY